MIFVDRLFFLQYLHICTQVNGIRGACADSQNRSHSAMVHTNTYIFISKKSKQIEFFASILHWLSQFWYTVQAVDSFGTCRWSGDQPCIVQI